MPKSRLITESCTHSQLQLEPSAYAVEAGFTWQSPADRNAATTKRGTKASRNRTVGGRAIQSTDAQLATFPGPLVLPWDDLGWDPEAESQSFKDWYQERHRNQPTSSRNTLYVVKVPDITKDVEFMRAWLHPQLSAGSKTIQDAPVAEPTPSPAIEDFVDYLAAFYHGFMVKPFPQPLRFVPWPTKPAVSKKTTREQYVGLASADGNATRIRARPSPDGVFGGQLNLEDILDKAIAMLPRDAYAITLLMDHDLYEDEDDDFCCGRAYGGSRVSVVSTSRYRPELDDRTKLDRAHMWPASHCRENVAKLCVEQGIHNSTRKVSAAMSSAMRVAVTAACKIKQKETPESLQGLWFSRLARTVAHELGHCMGLGHCVYYACLMQSTAGMAEDVRQPPYLCPVCMSKISYAASVELLQGSEETRQAYLEERYSALLSFCDRWRHVGLFAGYRAWLKVRLEDLTSH
jgi:archaemetzincin